MNIFDFYKGKSILITGHTGFKGSWMCQALLLCGANVTGYSLEPPTNPSLFEKTGIENEIKHVIGDIRDLDSLKKVFEECRPEIVIHMAAQPLVRYSYENPVETYETNVIGTVNLLECVRTTESVVSVVNVTTDKVYLNREREEGYREDEVLNGYDPYSNSKSCSELVTSSYINSFFNEQTKKGRKIAVTTMRAGNVIGGGDYALDRIIPDCVRAASKGDTIIVRNPYSTRPYQHVLEPVMAYLMVAARQYEDVSLAGSYNVGPDDDGCFTTGNLVNLFCKCWNKAGNEITWKNVCETDAPHEAGLLKLDCTKIKNTFGWKPVWKLEAAMDKIVEWTMADISGEDVGQIMNSQIEEYCANL